MRGCCMELDCSFLLDDAAASSLLCWVSMAVFALVALMSSATPLAAGDGVSSVSVPMVKY